MIQFWCFFLEAKFHTIFSHQQAGPSFFFLGFLFQILQWEDGFGSIFDLKSPLFIFFSLYFNLNKIFSHRSEFFSTWHRHMSVVVCFRRLVRRCFISRPVAVFIWFILKDRLFNQIFGRQRCRSEGMGIPVTLILSYIFVCIVLLYAINLDVVSLFADSSFTFLTMLNEWISFCFCQKKIKYFFRFSL